MQRYLGDQEAARKELALYPESVRQRLEAWQEAQGEWFSDTVLEIVAEFIKHDNARRIVSEQEAVPVAWMYERNGKACVSVGERSEDMLPAWTETPLYAHPPKEPDQSARIAELEAALREIKELTHRRQLPLTVHINDTATAALEENQNVG